MIVTVVYQPKVCTMNSKLACIDESKKEYISKELLVNILLANFETTLFGLRATDSFCNKIYDAT